MEFSFLESSIFLQLSICFFSSSPNTNDNSLHTKNLSFFYLSNRIIIFDSDFTYKIDL